jgi:hypothetical protein
MFSVVAHGSVEVAESVEACGSNQSTIKNSDKGEQSRRDAPKKPYHLSPGEGSQWTRLRRPAL